MILEDLGIPYHIIEARDRVGGRLYTHKFEKNSVGAPFNYYDVGGMRFPETPTMARLFHLFRDKKLNLEDKLQPYLWECDQAFKSFNGVTVQQGKLPNKSPEGPFKSNLIIKDTNPTPYIAAGVNRITSDVIKPFIKPQTGGKKSLLDYHTHSVRSYMTFAYEPSDEIMKEFGIPNGPLPIDVVNWCETFGQATSGYDMALSETVLYGGHPSSDTKWKCVM